MSFIETLIKPLLDAEREKGIEIGVLRERLVKEEEREKREYDLLCRGVQMGRDEILHEMESTIEEISAKEFEELAGVDKEPFGFVGTLDDLSLVIDGEVVG